MPVTKFYKLMVPKSTKNVKPRWILLPTFVKYFIPLFYQNRAKQKQLPNLIKSLIYMGHTCFIE